VTIQILTHAKEDLFDGYLFYERQQAGIGDYFLDSLSADIESLLLHHGYHRQFFGFHRMIALIPVFHLLPRIGRIDLRRCRGGPAKESHFHQTAAPSFEAG
jgi:hypothetical protein